jgi:DNA-binding transcriptional LysR family regulator
MDWDGFRVFLAVARAGRVSTAAKRLGVDQTTVSRRLAAFEEELGAPLFYRTGGPYRLTRHGQNALSNAEAMEQAALIAHARTQETAGNLAGRVRLAMLDEFASHWLAARLPEFRAQYPDIEIEIVAGIPPLDLSRGEADLAIRTPRPKQVGLAAVRLGSGTTALYASKTLIGKRSLFIHDVGSSRGLPFLVYPSEHHPLQSWPWFQPVLAQAKIALVTNSTHALVAAARSSLGVAVLPTFVGRAYDDLVRVSDMLFVGEHWLVLHPEFRRDPKVRALADFLKHAAVGPGGFDEGDDARPARTMRRNRDL